MTKRLFPLTCCVAAGLVLFAACSDSPTTDRSDAAKPVDAIVTTSTVPDVYDVVHPPATGEFAGALIDVSAHMCEQTADGWRVTGTATNSTAEDVDYRVYISLLNSSLMTRALVEAEVVGIAPGAAGSFEKLIAIPDTDLHCVLRVERRAANG